uniref:T-box domain-containing protein n=1 Tax=Ditylenchus dipsaci TaxID=166011 RepID=A0A915DLY9_9BILA
MYLVAVNSACKRLENTTEHVRQFSYHLKKQLQPGSTSYSSSHKQSWLSRKHQSAILASGLQVDIPENLIPVPASQPLNSSKLLKSAEAKNNNKLEKYTESRSQEESTSPLQQLPNWAPPGNPCSSTDIGQLECRLDAENKVLWKNFDKIGTEMIITKPGRRMFPTVKVRVENCNPEAMYYVYLDCIPVDGHRYRYVYTKSSWCNSGKADSTPPSRLYMHPDSPFSGAQLITSPTISFEKAKLTNNLGTGDKDPLLILNSMHKYQPRVHILQRLKSQTPLEHGGQNVVLQRYNGRYKSFQFKETRFMAVTAYQNQLVTKMKIKNNPFAKGFRETDKSDSNSISHRDGHLDAFNNSSSYSLPSPSLMNTSYLSSQPQLPVNSLVTFAQIAPLALAAIQHLPTTLRPPPPMVPPASWSVPWIKLSVKEQQSFLFYYQLTSSLTMQLANCSSASLNKSSNILEPDEIKRPETTETSSCSNKRRSLL